ncbi:MAG: Alpha/beta hydrolase family protein [Methanosaeta sp. PtaU1.Bin112]|nr:MAG: Alpha/beta hydrolase family protein [Methanosaeta sp. PtaU1.Bin112]
MGACPKIFLFSQYRRLMSFSPCSLPNRPKKSAILISSPLTNRPVKIGIGRPRKKNPAGIGILLLLIIVAAGGAYAWHEYDEFFSVPTSRLDAGDFYQEMPPDEHHHYLQIPLDHGNPSQGNFTAFYLLSPGFSSGRDVIFWLFDNQQERVGMINSSADFEYFEEILRGQSYVLMGNRGVSPTLFPEVFNKDGSTNYSRALRLYGSRQQVEDIEAVRQDMQRKGLLPEDGRIMLYGGSGGGFLVQQYLDRYGEHVSRAMIECSGAPDLAALHNTTFMKETFLSDESLANSYFSLMQNGSDTASLAFMLYKIGLAGDVQLQNLIVSIRSGTPSLEGELAYITAWLNPANNFPLVRRMLDAPRELEVKVRVYELVGDDLESYHPASAQKVCLGYEWIKVILADFLKAHEGGKIPVTKIQLNRSSYDGEVMIWSAAFDQVFSEQMGKWMRELYPHARLAIFSDSHERRKDPEYRREFRKAFFQHGLYSPEVQAYFDDPRQLNAAEKV